MTSPNGTRTAGLPAHDTGAERELLAIMLNSAAACGAVEEVLWPEDFWRPGHQVIYRAIQVMRAAAVPVDAVTLADWIQHDGDMKAIGGPEAGRHYLTGLHGTAMAWVMAPRLAEIIREKAVARRTDEALIRSRQLLRDGEGDLAELIGRIQYEVDAAAAHLAEGGNPLDREMNAHDFTTVHRVRLPAVIPGLAHLMDRVVLIGPEGYGKTLLLDQMGVCAAAGIHPFTREPVPPVRVLILDLENPVDLAQDRLAHMLALAGQAPGWDDSRLHVLCIPEGIDLAKMSDAFRIAQAIRAAEPDLVVAGPIAKMYDDTGERTDHTKVARFWDRARVRHRFTILLEHHPPAAQNIRRAWRPAGSNRWASSPEVGISLVPGTKDMPVGALRVMPYRGHRRPGMCWPEEIHRSLVGGWPWTARYATGTFDAPLTGGQ